MATAAKLWIYNCLDEIAFRIDNVHRASDADRAAFGVYKSLNVAHVLLTLSRGNRAKIANVKDGATLTSSLIQSDEYVRG